MTPSQHRDFSKRTLRCLKTALEKKRVLDEQIDALVAALADAPDVPDDDLKGFMAWADGLRAGPRRRGYDI